MALLHQLYAESLETDLSDMEATWAAYSCSSLGSETLTRALEIINYTDESQKLVFYWCMSQAHKSL